MGRRSRYFPRRPPQLLEGEDDIAIVGEASKRQRMRQMLAKLKPDILLLDLRMPDKDGLGVLEEVNFDSLPTRVIVLTAAEDDRGRCSRHAPGRPGHRAEAVGERFARQKHPQSFRGEIWLDNRNDRRSHEGFREKLGSGNRVATNRC